MRNLYLGIKFSFAYFSRIPISFKSSDDLSAPALLNIMLLGLPWVGLVLGLITIAVASLLSPLGWYGAMIAGVIYFMLYGFLHTEAIIDVFDALYASHAGKDAHTIIKEPTVGAIGVLYGVAFVLLKLSGMVWLFSHGILAEFVAVVIISRLSLLTLVILHDFNSTFLVQLKEALDYWYVMLIFVIFVFVGSYITLYFIPLMVIGLIVGFLISLYFASQLRFVNGDVLGATLEGVEIVLLVVVALLMS